MGWNKNSGETFTGRVRAAARKVGLSMDGTPIEFSVADLSHAVGVASSAESKKLHWALRDLKKAGELMSVRKGVYLPVEPKRERKPLEKRVVMWRFLRMRKRVTVGDLQEVAGVSEKYAEEWLQMLARRGIVKSTTSGKFQLLGDPVAMPANDEKAAKLRALRARKRAVMIGVVKAVHGSVCELCGLLEELVEAMSEEVDDGDPV